MPSLEGPGDRERELSTLEIFEARLADPHRLLGGGCESVLGRALCTEDVATVSAVVLRGGVRVGSRESQLGGWAVRLCRLLFCSLCI